MAARRRWWLVALLAVLVVVVAAVPALALRWVADDAQDEVDAAQPVPTTAAPAAGPSVATPILSTRRMPGVVTGKLTTASLLQGVQAVGQAAPEGSCLLVTLDGAPIYELRSDAPLIPASNQKLVTAAVALEVLGADRRYTTTVVAPPVQAGGVVPGDLTIVGGGDPLLATKTYLDWLRAAGKEPQDPHTSYEQLADQIVAAGVRRVDGAVTGQEGRYDGQRRVSTWPAGYRLSLEGGPLGDLVVNDGFASFTRPAGTNDPAQHAAAVMTELLRARGVQVAGAPKAAPAPAGAAELTRIDSVPMTEVVREMLTNSDNNTAELLLKEMGVAKAGAGTTAAGAQVVRDTLAAWGVPVQGVVVADGSGLDRTNQVTCREGFVAVLAHGGTALQQGLAVAGRTGTLADAFRGNPVEGRLLGKTGTLTGVKSLAGTLPVEAHDLDFALVLNGANANVRALPLWDRLGRALASYPDQPSIAGLGPLPPVGA